MLSRPISPGSVRSRVNSLGPAVAAIALGIMWAVSNTSVDDPRPERIVIIVVGIGLVATTIAGSVSAAFVGWYAILVALAERVTKDPLQGYSDVLSATREALDVVLQGGNPYTHLMTSTSPIGSPFPYPPGEFLFYLPAYLWFGDISRVDIAASVAITACIVLAGLRVGYDRVVLPAMVYATWLFSSFHAADGSNDTSAALLVVVAITLLALNERWPSRWLLLASAVSFGWAIAFKQFAIFLLVPAVRYVAGRGSWRLYLAVAGGTLAAFVLPFFVRDPLAFVGQQVAALTFHTEHSGVNIAGGLAGMGIHPPGTVFTALELFAAVVLLALGAIVPTGSLGRATLMGAGAVAVVILLAPWTSQGYWLYVGSVGLLGIALLDDRASRQPA